MIIKREFVTFRALMCTDPASARIIDDAFNRGFPEEGRESETEWLLDRSYIKGKWNGAWIQ